MRQNLHNWTPLRSTDNESLCQVWKWSYKNTDEKRALTVIFNVRNYVNDSTPPPHTPSHPPQNVIMIKRRTYVIYHVSPIFLQNVMTCCDSYKFSVTITEDATPNLIRITNRIPVVSGCCTYTSRLLYWCSANRISYIAHRVSELTPKYMDSTKISSINIA